MATSQEDFSSGFTKEMQREAIKGCQTGRFVTGSPNVQKWYKSDESSAPGASGSWGPAPGHNHAVPAPHGPAISAYTGFTTGVPGSPHCHSIPPSEVMALPAGIDKAVKEAVAHLVCELDGMTQRCEELEIELECMQNAFPEHDNDILPKHAGMWQEPFGKPAK